MSRVDIGFLEETEHCLLESHHFPSKIGGKPSWLSLKNLPKPEDLQCHLCTKQLIFLCQVYAPFEDDKKNFHRTLFIFICRDVNCCKRNENGNVKVFRNQLERQNEFYSYEPPTKETKFEVENFVKLCQLCGCFAEKHCSKCKDTSYCSREHQILDWKSGHKNFCQDRTTTVKNNVIFPEFELIIEEEQLISDKERDEKDRMEDYEKLASEGNLGTLNEISENELDSHVGLDTDKTFLRFKKRIENNPEQVLRYNRGGEPLWIAEKPKPLEVPKCEHCNSERQFEFQILPQLLFEMKEEQLDWGTLIIYSCKKSCVEGTEYKKEYVFKQDISE